MRGQDMFFCIFVIFNNVMVHRYRAKWPEDAFIIYTPFTVTYLALALVQSAWAAYPTPRYYSLRPLLLAVNR